MHKHVKMVKKLDYLLLNNNLDNDTPLTMLEVKKRIFFGKIDFTNGLTNSMLPAFYSRHVINISRWLNMPVDAVTKKINENDFTEVEHKLIITNIFILSAKEKEDVDE